MRYSRLASRLDEIEQCLPALILDQFADESTQAMDVLTQRLVLLGEEDVGAGDRL